MIVKLLNGDLLSIESDDINVARVATAKEMCVDVEDVSIIEIEEKAFAMAVILMKPRVFEVNLSDEKVIDEICNQISNPKFINTSLIEYFLAYIVDLPYRVSAPINAFASNPHPLIVEYLVTNFLGKELDIPLGIHMYLVRNPSDEIVNHPQFVHKILTSPNKITLINDLTANTNPTARKILVDFLTQFPDTVMWYRLCGIPDDGVITYLLSVAAPEKLLATFEFLRNPCRVATQYAMQNINRIAPANRFFFYVKCLQSTDADMTRYAIESKGVSQPVAHLLDNPSDVAVDLIISSLTITFKPTREQVRTLASNPSHRMLEYLLYNPSMNHLIDSPEFLCSPHQLSVHRIRRCLQCLRRTDWRRIVDILPCITNPDIIWHILKQEEQRIRSYIPHLIMLISRVEDIQVIQVKK